jgi:hypothetical protein
MARLTPALGTLAPDAAGEAAILGTDWNEQPKRSENDLTSGQIGFQTAPIPEQRALGAIVLVII